MNDTEYIAKALVSDSNGSSAAITTTTTPMTTTTTTATLATTTAAKNPSSWDPQDDILLRHLKEVKRMGWKDISQYFDNRTPNACQFRWRRLKSGNLKSNKTAEVDVSEYALDVAPHPQPPTTTGVADIADKPRFSSAYADPAAGPYTTHAAPGSTKAASRQPHSGKPGTPASVIVTPATPEISGTPGPLKTSGPAAVAAAAVAAAAGISGISGISGLPQIAGTPGMRPNPPAPDEEIVGFVPKIVVRSRRGSSVAGAETLAAVLNTTLNSAKSRKNSFSTRSRRSSFNLASSSASRRSSLGSVSGIGAPFAGSYGGYVGNGGLSPNSGRRHSIVVHRPFGLPPALPRHSVSGAAEPRTEPHLTSGFATPPSKELSPLLRESPVPATDTRSTSIDREEKKLPGISAILNEMI